MNDQLLQMCRKGLIELRCARHG